jgi:hypothetical protein
MAEEKCPKCGGKIVEEATSMTGNKIYEYTCIKCGWERIEDRGPALWKVLSDDREEREREEKRKKKKPKK